MVVVVVVVTVMVRLIANKSEPLRSWMDGGMTGRPSRRFSRSPRPSLRLGRGSRLVLDRLELVSVFRLLECFRSFRSLSLCGVEGPPPMWLLWLLLRLGLLSTSLLLSLTRSLSLGLSLSLYPSLVLSLTLLLPLSASLSSYWLEEDLWSLLCEVFAGLDVSLL